MKQDNPDVQAMLHRIVSYFIKEDQDAQTIADEMIAELEDDDRFKEQQKGLINVVTQQCMVCKEYKSLEDIMWNGISAFDTQEHPNGNVVHHVEICPACMQKGPDYCTPKIGEIIKAIHTVLFIDRIALMKQLKENPEALINPVQSEKN